MRRSIALSLALELAAVACGGSGTSGGAGGAADPGGETETTGGAAGSKSGTGGASGRDASARVPGDAGDEGQSDPPGRDAASVIADAPADTTRVDGSTFDLAPPATGPTSCGLVGQVCCGGNTCMAGKPVIKPGGATETTVLQLRASGGDPYTYFGLMKLLPIDGPDSGYITDTGTSFRFVLHQDGAEETVSSGALRQRNEVTVNPGNPTIYKALKGDTITYAWRFRLERVNAQPTWTDFFQVKQHGTTGTGPYMAFEADKANFNVKTARSGIVATLPLASVMGAWIEARVTLKFDDSSPTTVTLRKVEDGTTLLNYSGVLDNWDTTIDFVRPKWGFYRNKAAGAGEAAVEYNDMRIIRHFPDGPCACAP